MEKDADEEPQGPSLKPKEMSLKKREKQKNIDRLKKKEQKELEADNKKKERERH
jgi:hypothetical protein